MLALVAVMVAATLPAPQRATYEKDYLELQQEFTERTNKLMGAIQNNQTDVIESLVAKDFSLSLHLEDKAPQVLPYSEWMRSAEHYTLENFQLKRFGVHNFYPVMIVNYRAIRTDQLGSAMRVTGKYVVTDVWVARGKIWELKRRFMSRPIVLTPDAE
jgi:hypothetical protein